MNAVCSITCSFGHNVLNFFGNCWLQFSYTYSLYLLCVPWRSLKCFICGQVLSLGMTSDRCSLCPVLCYVQNWYDKGNSLCIYVLLDVPTFCVLFMLAILHGCLTHGYILYWSSGNNVGPSTSPPTSEHKLFSDVTWLGFSSAHLCLFFLQFFFLCVLLNLMLFWCI